MNGRAMIVTANLRDFRLANQSLGVRVVSPIELVKELVGLH